jgi:multidrug efflux pump subunit AcrB
LRSKPIGHSLYTLYQQEWTPVLMKSRHAEAFSTFQLSDAQLSFTPEQALKMSQVSTLQFEKTSSALYKENRQYLRVIGFEYYGSDRFGKKYLQEVLEGFRGELPIGYSAEAVELRFGEAAKAKRRYSLLLVMLVGIFLVCSILFENLRQPLMIIFTIPLSFIGLFLIFAWGSSTSTKEAMPPSLCLVDWWSMPLFSSSTISTTAPKSRTSVA